MRGPGIGKKGISSLKFYYKLLGANTMVLESIPKVAGFGYGIIVFFLLVYLWYSKRITRKRAFLFLVISTALGFLIFAPVLPWQFMLLVLRDTKGLGGPVQAAAFGLLFILGFTFLFGRIFCGHMIFLLTVI